MLLLNFLYARQEVLKVWKRRQVQATYGNLLQALVDAGEAQCAETLCKVLRKKCNLAMNHYYNCMLLVMVYYPVESELLDRDSDFHEFKAFNDTF